jgi:hypothetical protein
VFWTKRNCIVILFCNLKKSKKDHTIMNLLSFFFFFLVIRNLSLYPGYVNSIPFLLYMVLICLTVFKREYFGVIICVRSPLCTYVTSWVSSGSWSLTNRRFYIFLWPFFYGLGDGLFGIKSTFSDYLQADL